MRADSYPDDIRNYDHVPGSPFYEDPSDGLEELTLEELSGLLDALESAAENEDCPRKARHAAERQIPYVRAAIEALPDPEEEEEDQS
jgi:hypothetical protein